MRKLRTRTHGKIYFRFWNLFLFTKIYTISKFMDISWPWLAWAIRKNYFSRCCLARRSRFMWLNLPFIWWTPLFKKTTKNDNQKNKQEIKISGRWQPQPPAQPRNKSTKQKTTKPEKIFPQTNVYMLNQKY